MTAVALAPPPPAPAHPLALVVERVQLRARRRLAWLQHLDRTAQGDLLLRDALDDAADEAGFYAAQAPLHALGQRLAVVESRLADGPEAAPLDHLAAVFDLEPGELDVLQTCLALELAPALAPAFAALACAGPGVSEPLVRRLFGHDLGAPLVRPGGPLLTWRLVTAGEPGPGEPPLLRCDPQVRTWLSGQMAIHPLLAPQVVGLTRRPPLAGWPVEPVAVALGARLRAGADVRLIVAGAAGSGRRSFAALVFAALDIPTFALRSSRVDDAAWPEFALLAVREALVAGAAPVWEHVEHRTSALRPLAALRVQAIVCGVDERPPPIDGVVDLRVALPVPGVDERAALWRGYLPAAATWPEGQLLELAARFPLTPGELASVAAERPASPEEAAERCRDATRHRLGELGRRLRGSFGWDDLVLPPRVRQRLADLVFEARDRARFWELPQARRLYPRGAGLVALFTGPAGTGKTMAAQVLASELGLDLVRVDLAAAISKYIGETAKHLARIFRAAAGMGAVLFFDEADALFARRTDVRDAHDRHANTDTNYLLQLVEDFSGVAVLASNKKANLDPAFTRRIRHVLDFPRPDPPTRRQIWTRVLGELEVEVPEAALADLAALDLSGAQIKNAVLAAAFVARGESRRLGLAHLVRGAERELDKDGQLLDTHARERLTRHE